MLNHLLIKLLGGYTAPEVQKIQMELSETVRSLEPYREFAASISYYVGSYPAWKAQSEYREMLGDLGHPLSGEYPSGPTTYPTHAENVDIYLAKVVDGLAELRSKLPESIPGSHWDGENLAFARGDVYLQKSVLE